MRQAPYSILQRIFVFALVFLLQLPNFSGIACAGDSTSFNPVPIPVVAKGAGGVPVGTIIAWPVAQNPADMENWLECNGQSISASVYPELSALVGAKVPDFRGVFLRGVDAGKGYDIGRIVGSYQEDMVGPHVHRMKFWRHNADGGGIWAYPKYDADDGTLWTHPNDGLETRPKNMSVRYFIRAQQ